MLAAIGRMPPGARWLARFWGGVLTAVAVGGIVLQVLGPAPSPSRLAVATVPVPTLVAPPWDGKIAAPDASLLEPSAAVPGLMLPRVGAGGRTPRGIYARPTPPPDGRPRIALLLSGMGLSETDSMAAIRALPAAVTLAISPYAANAGPVLDAARAHGHELLASIPMEADRGDSAGRRALLTGNSAAENQANLEWALGRTQGYAGVTGAGDNGLRGERYAAQLSSFAAMLEQIGQRGLFYVDPRPDTRTLPVAVPAAHISVVIDDQPARAEIEGRLAEIERIARERGSVVALVGPPRRAMVERLAAWTATLEERGFVLVPVSALVTDP